MHIKIEYDAECDWWNWWLFAEIGGEPVWYGIGYESAVDAFEASRDHWYRVPIAVA
jgi:hypothetical protein